MLWCVSQGHFYMTSQHCKRLVSFLSLQCSKSCGAGHQRRALQCVDHNQQEVHEMYCVNLIRPPDIESCNTQACELIWITGEWTEVRVKEGCVPLKRCFPTKRLWDVCYEQAILYFSKRPSSNPLVRKWQKSCLFPVWKTVVVSCWWFILSSSVQPAVARATASVWSPAARCMWRMKTMSTAISLCPTALGHPLRATCLVIWTRAHRRRSGGLEFGDRWASPWFKMLPGHLWGFRQDGTCMISVWAS